MLGKMKIFFVFFCAEDSRVVLAVLGGALCLAHSSQCLLELGDQELTLFRLQEAHQGLQNRCIVLVLTAYGPAITDGSCYFCPGVVSARIQLKQVQVVTCELLHTLNFLVTVCIALLGIGQQLQEAADLI